MFLTQLLVNLPQLAAEAGDDRERLSEWLPDRWKRREAERAAAGVVG